LAATAGATIGAAVLSVAVGRAAFIVSADLVLNAAFSAAGQKLADAITLEADLCIRAFTAVTAAPVWSAFQPVASMVDADPRFTVLAATTGPAFPVTAVISTLLALAVGYAASRNTSSRIALLSLCALSARPATAVITAHEVLARRLAAFALHADFPHVAADVSTNLVFAQASAL